MQKQFFTPQPKYLKAKDAAKRYGVHKDFFRKTPEIHRYCIKVTSRTTLYSVERLDTFFSTKGCY